MKSFEYVLAISETGSVSEAASRLGIAQPALSRYIQKLEKELGVELFDRTTLPLSLTEAGRHYASASRQILNMNHQLEKRLEEVKARGNIEIRIGTGPSRAPVLMPAILREFSATHPDVRVLTYECRTAELAEWLERGKLDLIISFLDAGTAKFGMEDLFSEKVELAVPENFHAEADAATKNGKIDIRELQVPFISLHEGQQLRNALDILTRCEKKPLYTSEYQQSAMALVSQGFGVALVPSYWKLIDEGKGIYYYPLAIPEDLSAGEHTALMEVIRRRIGIFYRKEQFLSGAERAYIKAAKKVCEQIK